METIIANVPRRSDRRAAVHSAWSASPDRPTLQLVRERSGSYDAEEHGPAHGGRFKGGAVTSADGAPLAGTEASAPTSAEAALARLAGAVDGMLAVDLDLLDDDGLRGLLKGAQRQFDRLASLRATATGVLGSRQRARRGPGQERKAERDTERFLKDELHLPPGEAKAVGRTGQGLKDAPETAAAFADGRLGAEHAKVITNALRDLDPAQRQQLESELTRLAATMDPVALGRIARRRIAELDQGAAVADEARRHARRFTRISQNPDGSVYLSARLTGVPGEAAMTALHAFTRPDGPGTEGTREQRAADALGDIFLAALQTAEAPTQHGVRPHVTVLVHLSDLARQAGAAELDWTGPITVTEVHRWLSDAHITGVLLDPETPVPVALTGKRPTIPAHLWTALRVRDGGCRYPGCDRRPSWCDAAHAIAVDDGGATHLSQLVLLCREHHRLIDLGRWTITVDGATVTFTHPNGRTLTSTRGDP
jgi:hypothetical protein